MEKNWIKTIFDLFNWPIFWIVTVALISYFVLAVIFNGYYYLIRVVIIIIVAFTGAKYLKLEKEALKKSTRSLLLSMFFVGAMYVIFSQN